MPSYSTREMRRMGDQATVGPPPPHVAAKIPTPTGAGEDGAPPSSPLPPSADAPAPDSRGAERSALVLDEHAGATARSAPKDAPTSGAKSAWSVRIDE